MTATRSAVERIAILDGGEAAIRFVDAVAERNAESGSSIRTIALVGDADRRARHAREADEVVPLGPVAPAARGERPGADDLRRWEEALRTAGAHAVWPGWGPAAETPEVAELVAGLGMVWIGPDADTLRRLVDAVALKRLAEGAGVPVIPWSGGAVADLDEARAAAAGLGYPVMVKAAVRTGRRYHRADDESQLGTALAGAADDAGPHGVVLVERALPSARHLEVQVIADAAGTVWPVGVRDATVQRRGRRILAEAPPPGFGPELDHAAREWARRLAAAAGVVGAVTVELLLDPHGGGLCLVGVSPRLRAEHAVTEATTGVDLVKLQLHVALGGRLEGEPPPTVGAAVGVRICAEDPERDLEPTPGRVDVLRLPAGPGLRVDTGVDEGDEVPAHDPLVATVVATGRDRREALARLDRALRQTGIVIRGGVTTAPLLRRLLATPELRAGAVDLDRVDRVVGPLGRVRGGHADVALVAAAITGYQEQEAVDVSRFRASALRGRPELGTEVGRVVELRFDGHRYRFEVRRVDAERYRVDVDGAALDVEVDERGPRAGVDLTVGGRRHHVRASVHGATHLVEIDGHSHRIRHDEGGVVRAPSPAIVVSLPVRPGDEVASGDRVAVLEAMKMETAVLAGTAGRVRAVLAGVNAHVDAGAPLVVIEPHEPEAEAGPRVVFDALVVADRSTHRGCRHHLEAVRQLLLGYDVDLHDLDGRDPTGGAPCGDELDPGEQSALEEEILSLFVDVVSLFRRSPVDEELDLVARRSAEEHLFHYLRRLEAVGEGLPERFLGQLRRALAHFDVADLEPTPELEAALYRIARSHQRLPRHLGPVLQVLEHRLDQPTPAGDAALASLLDRIVRETRHRFPAVHDLATELRYRTFDEPFLADARARALADADRHLDALDADPIGPDREAHVVALVDCPQPLTAHLSGRFATSGPEQRGALLEVMTRRYYRIRDLGPMRTGELDGVAYAWADYDRDGEPLRVVSAHTDESELDQGVRALRSLVAAAPPDRQVVVDLYLWRPGPGDGVERTRERVGATLGDVLGDTGVRRVVVAVSSPQSGPTIAGVLHLAFRRDDTGRLAPHVDGLDVHPLMAERLQTWRLEAFELTRIPTPPDVYLFHGRARENQRDERLFALAEVRDLTAVRDEAGVVQRLPELERVLREVLGAVRRVQAHRPPGRRLHWNRVLLYVWPPIDLTGAEMSALAERMAPDTADLGIEKVQLLAQVVEGGSVRPRVVDISNPTGDRVQLRIRDRADEPLRPLDAATHRVVSLRQRGLVSPFDLVRLLAGPEGEPTGVLPPGSFTEHDLDGDRLVPVDRPDGENRSNVVVGVVTNVTATHPEGMRRVILLGDPSRGMGSLAEPECRRIMAAIDLAEELGVPVEWFAVSAGALISMDSGTENMDWIARVLRRIIEFTQDGGELNVVVAGINVGAQPYWNAEATMLMHTKGILVMIPESAMVLTGKDALDYSGGVSAEDNLGVGGYERIMGPNGQAQYLARDLHDACRILLRHYEHAYVVPGERFPRPAVTTDPRDRDVRPSPHGGEFPTVGDVFSDAMNPDRKRPFEIRRVMAAAVDHDHPTLERWYGMESAELAVVWDAHLGGHPVCLLGIESKNLPRPGFVPADGPSVWTAGTLFPMGSKKVARAINAASGNRPLVVLANLSGFDGSPESLRQWQLEYGAEIGRAVVNFRGPIVFCVVSRYHGGAFVVFSGALHDNMEVVALEGSRASVIGGAPAAAVVFAREVARRADADPELVELEQRAEAAEGAERAELRARLVAVRAEAHSRALGEVAAEFDAIHDVERALRVGSLDRIISVAELRPYLIDAVERGMARELERHG